MLPSYTFALGKTDAVEKIMTFLSQQESVKQTILKKQENKTDFNIGADSTFDDLREVIRNEVK